MAQAVADGITVPIKYRSRIARVFLDDEKAAEIEEYYAQCAEDGATPEAVAKSKRAMSSMEVILGERSRLERLAEDIHDHYEASRLNHPERVQKAMIVCSSRKIAYTLFDVFRSKYPEWLVEKKHPDYEKPNPEELRELTPRPFIAMVASVGNNDPEEMYNYLGGTGNDSRCQELEASFKQDKSNFRIAIVVDMWITGFDVPSLTYMYNDKPLKKHMLIQTISRVNRRYKGKDYGLVVDYIGIRGNMQEAMRLYGYGEYAGNSEDDAKRAAEVFRAELDVLQRLFHGYDLKPFMESDGDTAGRFKLLSRAAEYVFSSAEELKTERRNGKAVEAVPFRTYFLGRLRRMRAAYEICQPAGELGGEETSLAQCFMAVGGLVRKMNGTAEIDPEVMNIHVRKMVEEALKYSEVESVLDCGIEEDIFSPENLARVTGMNMPATRLEMLVRMLREEIKK
ncbi:MAG: type I restriction endonuclease subunit R, partial [Synergistaceae bacterium]|nr:type I restriction endonuclease subunit R [Synergistaceae bacterium]